MAPKPKGPGLSQEEVVVIFNRIVDRLILLSKQKYKFESRHEGITDPYDYFEFGQEYVRQLGPNAERPGRALVLATLSTPSAHRQAVHGCAGEAACQL